MRFAWLDTYIAHDDPIVRAGNVIALVVAANQPFYPLYVYWVIGHDVMPSLLTFLSTPFFALVPALARRNATAGRAMLVLAGTANTVMVTKLYGQSSGVELFLLPCMLIAAAFFRSSERVVSLVLLAIGAAVFLGLDGRYGAAACACSPSDARALLSLHALSVGTLTVFIGFLLSGLTGSGSLDSRKSPPRP